MEITCGVKWGFQPRPLLPREDWETCTSSLLGRLLSSLSFVGGRRASTTSSDHGWILRTSVSGARGRAQHIATAKNETAGILKAWRAILRDAIYTARQSSNPNTSCLAATCPDPSRLHSGKYSSPSVDWPAVDLPASMRRVRLVKASHLQDSPNLPRRVIGRACFETPSRKICSCFRQR